MTRNSGRALVTDLRLEAAVSLPPCILGSGYRHDCKHDTGPTAREVIHDTVYVGARVPHRALPFAPPGAHAEAGALFEAEANIPPVFQAAKEEPDAGRLSFEAELVPFATAGGGFRLFADCRVSLLYRRTCARVASSPGWNVDALVRAGAEYRAGVGSVRLAYCLERLTDDWASLSPEPVTISAVTLALVWNAESERR